MKKVRHLVTGIVCIAALILLIACGGGAASQGQSSATGTGTAAAGTQGTASPVLKDTIVAVISGNPASLDPQSANTIIISSVLRNFFDALIDEKPDGSVEPRLATSWTFLDDTTIRFKLREGVVFHNGNPFTAEDVLYTFQRAKKTPLSASTYQYIDAENSVIVDDYTIDVKLVRPYAALFNTLSGARGYIVDKEYTESVGDAHAAINPVGTGPYSFVSWVSGSEIRGTRNDAWWDTPAVTKNIVLKIIPEASSRTIELETGNADIVYEIPSTDVRRVDEMANAHTESDQSYRYYTLTASMKDPVLANKDLRYALSYAIDKEALVKAVFGDTAVAANGFYPSNVFAFKDTGILPYDLEQAKALMVKAGYPDGVRLKFNYSAREIDIRLAEAIQNMWAQIGVAVDVYQMDSAPYLAQGHAFQLGLRAGNANEPSNILIIYDSAFADKIQSNDQKLDDMLHEAMTVYDVGERAQRYGEIQDYLYDVRYSIPLAFTNAIYGVSDKVGGFIFDANQQLDLWKFSVAQ